MKREQGNCFPDVARTLSWRYDSSPCDDRGQNIVVCEVKNENKAISFQERAGCAGGEKGILIHDEKTGALSTLCNQAVVYGVCAKESNSMKSDNPHSGFYEAETSRTLDNNGGNPNCAQGGMIVLEGNGSRPSHRGDGYEESEVSYTLNSVEQHAVAYRKTAHPRTPEEGQGYEEAAVADTMNGSDITEARTPMLVCDARGNGDGKVSPTITGDHWDRVTDYTALCVGESAEGESGKMTLGRDRASFNQGKNAKFDFSVEEEKVGAQTSKGPGAVCTSIVRRLTPLECTRLQGFPSGWVDIGEWTDSKGKKHKDADAPKYKALGNNIAVGFANNRSGFWMWLVRRISAQYERAPTLGSLFDGIGGFPLAWEATNGIGTTLWASEIEEFCIAVTKKHFGDGEHEGDLKEYL